MCQLRHCKSFLRGFFLGCVAHLEVDSVETAAEHFNFLDCRLHCIESCFGIAESELADESLVFGSGVLDNETHKSDLAAFHTEVAKLGSECVPFIGLACGHCDFLIGGHGTLESHEQLEVAVF